MPHVFRHNCVHLRLRSEPSPPLSDKMPAETPDPSFAQSHESQTNTAKEVNLPTLSWECLSLSSLEVPSTASESPPRSVLRQSERQRWPPEHLSDFVLSKS